MLEYTDIQISTKLKDELQKTATEKNTDIDNIIKLALEENKQLRKNPERSLATTKVSSKDNKNKKGEVTSQTHSTVIPKPIISKLGLETKQLLYWDIDDNKIIITPEVNPAPTRDDSIPAGLEILNDFILNGNNHYGTYATNILSQLKSQKTKEDKIETITTEYKTLLQDNAKDEFTKVVLYLLDYPLNLPDQYEILKEVYDEITKD